MSLRNGKPRDNTITWLEQNQESKEIIEQLVKEKLTEGSEVSANSMRPLAAAARNASSRPTLRQVSANG